MKPTTLQLMKPITCLLLLFTLQITNLTAQAVEKLRIDPSMAFGGTVSEYFEEVNYIPLETTKQSLFGDINQLVITDSSYVIFDFDTRSVLFFSLAGKYMTKIKLKENVWPWLAYEKPQHRLSMSFYDSQAKKNEVKYYSITGRELAGKRTEAASFQSHHIPLNNGFSVATGYCYFDNGMKPVDSVAYLLKVYKNDTSLYKSFFPYNQTVNMAACAFGGGFGKINASEEKDAVYVSPPFDGGIYKVTKDSAIKLYQVVLPLSRAVPKYISQSNDNRLIDSLRNANWPDENTITGLTNIFMFDDFLLFKLNAGRYSWTQGAESTKQYNFIYNRKTDRLVSIERMKPDELNGFLPFADWRINYQGLNYIDGFFYTTLSSLQLFNAKEATADKKPKYSPAIEKFFTTENRKSNPVIVQLKLKKQ
jgi:hypothetical protein